jgi:hypothetical protein
MSNSGPGTGPAGRRLLAALDRLITGDTVWVHADPDERGNFQLDGQGHAYQWRTIVHLADAGLLKVVENGAGYVLAFTATGRALLGA